MATYVVLLDWTEQGVGKFQGCLPASWSSASGGTITNVQLNGCNPRCRTSDYTLTNDANGQPQTITWTGNPKSNVTVSYTWKTPGPCGPPPGNASSHCITVVWRGAQIGGGDPGGGQDFGMQAIRLCNPTITASCPSGS